MTAYANSPLDLVSLPGRPLTLKADPGGDALSWVGRNRDQLRQITRDHGALVVRGLDLRAPSQVAAVFQLVGAPLLAETETFAPREAHGNGVYGATSWPQRNPMCMHHELSYRLEVPGLMMIACLVPPTTGGATALADAAAVLDSLPTDLVRRFDRHGWLLTRTFNGEIGPSVADAFGTDDRTELKAYCRSAAIDIDWLPDGGVRTVQRRLAVVDHPVTGARCWFNQVAFLNEWTLEPEIRDILVDTYGSDGLPFNTSFGDGSPIEAEVVDLLNAVYEANTVREPWQQGDLMLVDNIRTAHSREPYTGNREVLVAMADPIRMRLPGGIR
jgi:hypothetical protein